MATSEGEPETGGLREFLEQLDAELQALRVIARAIVQRMALNSGRPHAFAADFFAGISALLDAVDEEPVANEYGTRRRGRVRASIDDFAGEMQRDLTPEPPRQGEAG